jgi:hypothetical protein
MWLNLILKPWQIFRGVRYTPLEQSKLFWFCSFQSNTDLIIGLLKRRSLEGVRVKDRLAVRGSRLPRPVVFSAPKGTVEKLEVCLRIFFYNLFYEFRVYVWIENAFDGLHLVWLRFGFGERFWVLFPRWFIRLFISSSVWKNETQLFAPESSFSSTLVLDGIWLSEAGGTAELACCGSVWRNETELFTPESSFSSTLVLDGIWLSEAGGTAELDWVGSIVGG